MAHIILFVKYGNNFLQKFPFGQVVGARRLEAPHTCLKADSLKSATLKANRGQLPHLGGGHSYQGGTSS